MLLALGGCLRAGFRVFAPSLLELPALEHEHLLREGHWGGTGGERQGHRLGKSEPGEGFCEHQGSWREVSYTSDIPWGLPGTVCPRAGSVALWEPHPPLKTALPLGQTPRPKRMTPFLRGVFPEQLHVCPGVSDRDEGPGSCLKQSRIWERGERGCRWTRK